MSDAISRCLERENGTGPECIRASGHIGQHRTMAGVRWSVAPDPALVSDVPIVVQVPETIKAPGFNSVVADTVRMHAAQARLDHSRAVAALESLPTPSSNARVLRARRDRLQAEAMAWAHLESVVSGS